MNDVTVEIWRAIPGYVGLYEVSSLGRVMSLPRARTPGGILKPQVAGKAGHLAVNLYAGSKASMKREYIHRLVMLAFAGPCPEGLEVRHLDTHPANNCYWNLAYGTHQENALDEVRLGNHPLASRTHCDKGHEFTTENTYVDRKGARLCRTCSREYQRDYQREWARRNPDKVRAYNLATRKRKRQRDAAA